MDGHAANHECKGGDDLEVQERLPCNTTEASQPSMASDSCGQRAENEWGDNDPHESQEYLRENMKMNGNGWRVYAKLCACQDCEEGPCRD